MGIHVHGGALMIWIANFSASICKLCKFYNHNNLSLERDRHVVALLCHGNYKVGAMNKES